MFYEKPMPFYMSYPMPWLTEEEWQQRRDLQRMKACWSKKAARIQELAEEECDRLEYGGSRMYDEYPDRWMMRRLCGKIEKRLKEQGEAPAGGEQEENLRDLIEVLLYHEIYRRRCSRRKCRTFF